MLFKCPRGVRSLETLAVDKLKALGARLGDALAVVAADSVDTVDGRAVDRRRGEGASAARLEVGGGVDARVAVVGHLASRLANGADGDDTAEVTSLSGARGADGGGEVDALVAALGVARVALPATVAVGRDKVGGRVATASLDPLGGGGAVVADNEVGVALDNGGDTGLVVVDALEVTEGTGTLVLDARVRGVGLESLENVGLLVGEEDTFLEAPADVARAGTVGPVEDKLDCQLEFHWERKEAVTSNSRSRWGCSGRHQR